MTTLFRNFQPEPIDKSSWGPGEWQEEKDYEHFVTSSGYEGCVWRMKSGGQLNGYVKVPSYHSLHNKDYNTRLDLRKEAEEKLISSPLAALIEAFKEDGLVSLECLIEIHGGLTFSSRFKGCEEWIFGFDCAHSGDIQPEYAAKYGMRYSEDSYRNFEYVKEQVEKLASQLKSLESIVVPEEKED